MKRFTLALGVMVAGLTLAASPALAQKPGDSGGGSPHTGGGFVNSGGGGGGGGNASAPSAPSGVAMPASSGGSSGSSGSAMSSPSAGTAMATSMSSASAAAPRQAAPQHRTAGWAPGTQGRFIGAQRPVNGLAIPRNDSTPIAGSGARTPHNPDTRAVPDWARPRPGGGNTSASTDTAVPRTTPRPQPGNGNGYVYVNPYQSCYLYRDCGGGYGYGYYDYYDPFYGSIYSPFLGYGMGLGLDGYPVFGGYASGDEYNYGVGSYSTSDYASHEEGNLKLKVKPRSAKVYVDGYFVGIVDEFDGAFQKLPLTAGRHHVKIEAEGYQTEEFDANITATQTVTFQGTLKKLQ